MYEKISPPIAPDWFSEKEAFIWRLGFMEGHYMALQWHIPKSKREDKDED